MAYVVDRFSYEEKKNKLDFTYLKKKFNHHTKKIWDKIYPKETWDQTYKKFDNPEYIQVSTLNFGKKFYNEFHSEALKLEHVEIN